MVLKNNYTVETQFDGNLIETREIEKVVSSLFENLNLDLPEGYIGEIVNFGKRNSLTKELSLHESTDSLCCLSCLKAHAIESAKRYGLSLKQKELIINQFGKEVGHSGYYLDCEELKEIS